VTAPRKTARLKLAELLGPALVGPGLPAQAVYPYRRGDFAGQSPVVAVTSGPIEHVADGFGCTKAAFQLLVFIFVLYADPASGWTEGNAEDTLDEIEAIIAEVTAANSRSEAWTQIKYAAPTQPNPVVIGGVEYLRELITFDVEVKQ